MALLNPLASLFLRQQIFDNTRLTLTKRKKSMLGLPRIIRLKETLQNSITARFTGPLVLEDPLLCGVGLVFPMRCLRSLFHEEIALLSVHKFPLPELTPFRSKEVDNSTDFP